MCTVQGALYIMCTVQGALYNVYCTGCVVYNVYCTGCVVYNVYCTLCTVAYTKVPEKTRACRVVNKSENKKPDLNKLEHMEFQI